MKSAVSPAARLPDVIVGAGAALVVASKTLVLAAAVIVSASGLTVS